jgi:hypothetical protein
MASIRIALIKVFDIARAEFLVNVTAICNSGAGVRPALPAAEEDSRRSEVRGGVDARTAVAPPHFSRRSGSEGERSCVDKRAVGLAVIVEDRFIRSAAEARWRRALRGLREHHIAIESRRSAAPRLRIAAAHPAHVLREANVELYCHVSATTAAVGKDLHGINIQNGEWDR